MLPQAFVEKFCLWKITWTLTFGWSLRAVWGDLPHAVAVAAESHQAGDYGRLAKANVANEHHAPVGSTVGAAQLSINFLEKPLPPRKHRVHRDAGNLKEQRLQRYVLEPVWSEAHWGERERERKHKSNSDSQVITKLTINLIISIRSCTRDRTSHANVL